MRGAICTLLLLLSAQFVFTLAATGEEAAAEIEAIRPADSIPLPALDPTLILGTDARTTPCPFDGYSGLKVVWTNTSDGTFAMFNSCDPDAGFSMDFRLVIRDVYTRERVFDNWFEEGMIVDLSEGPTYLDACPHYYGRPQMLLGCSYPFSTVASSPPSASPICQGSEDAAFNLGAAPEDGLEASTVFANSCLFPIYKDLSDSRFGVVDFSVDIIDDLDEDEEQWIWSWSIIDVPYIIGPAHLIDSDSQHIHEGMLDDSISFDRVLNWDSNPAEHPLLGSTGQWQIFTARMERGSLPEMKVITPITLKDGIVRGLHDMSIDGITSSETSRHGALENAVTFVSTIELAPVDLEDQPTFEPSFERPCTSAFSLDDEFPTSLILDGKKSGDVHINDLSGSVQFEIDVVFDSACEAGLELREVSLRRTANLWLGPDADEAPVLTGHESRVDLVRFTQTLDDDTGFHPLVLSGGWTPTARIGCDDCPDRGRYQVGGSPVFKVDYELSWELWSWEVSTAQIGVCLERHGTPEADSEDCLADNAQETFSHHVMVV